MVAKNIEEVISRLEEIIEESKTAKSPIGYFPALYKRVTEAVRDGIQRKEFQNNDRMEELDVVFANRYLTAYDQYKNGNPCSVSWTLAFEATGKNKLIVLQHLFLGMNAHINLDLGLAAAEIAPGEKIESLKQDFMSINAVLGSLVNEVQNELSSIWPLLRFIDRMAGTLDEGLADFSMSIARDGAWKVAKDAAGMNEEQLNEYIDSVDQKATRFGQKVEKPGFILGLLVWLIRVTERGDVNTKINTLNT